MLVMRPLWHHDEIVVLIANKGMRIALMALALCAMTGCQPQPPQQASEVIAKKEPSDMRTAVAIERELLGH
jgi:hypothetical protein